MSETKSRSVAWRDYMTAFAYTQLSNFKDRDGDPIELTEAQARVIAQNASRMATALTGYDPNRDPEEAPQQ